MQMRQNAKLQRLPASLMEAGKGSRTSAATNLSRSAALCTPFASKVPLMSTLQEGQRHSVQLAFPTWRPAWMCPPRSRVSVFIKMQGWLIATNRPQGLVLRICKPLCQSVMELLTEFVDHAVDSAGLMEGSLDSEKIRDSVLFFRTCRAPRGGP